MPAKKQVIKKDRSPVIEDTFKIVPILADDPDLDPVSALREGIEDDQSRILIRRIEPKEHDGKQIDGYLSDLPENEIDRFEIYIKTQYGGGLYQIEKRNQGKLEFRGRLKISGPPKTILSQPPSKENNLLTDEQTEGVSIGGTWREYEERIMRIMTIKKLFENNETAPPPPPVDINSVLLQHILNQSAPMDINSQLSTLQTLIEAAKSFSGDGGSETNLMDLLKEGVKTFGVMMNKTGPGQVPMRRPAGNIEVKNRAPQVVQPGTETDKKMLTAGEEIMQKPDLRTIAGTAINNIVATFSVKPDISPGQMVDVLDNVVNVDDEDLPKLVGYKQMLLNMAMAQLSDTLIDDDELKQKFENFFNETFDLFCRQGREKIIL